jgi:hypothetical protein
MVLRGHWAHRRTDHLIKHLFNERRTNASMCQIITNAREGNSFRTYILHVHKICRFLRLISLPASNPCGSTSGPFFR